jgi:hypothetical protein
MYTILGGKVCTNVKAQRTSYFKTHQGLGQVDPLSPIMFNMATEVLTTVMRKASHQGKIKGVMSHLLPEGLTHVQYTDDTILIVEEG